MNRMLSRLALAGLLLAASLAAVPAGAQEAAPSPLLKTGQPVAWWFMFKLNATFPGCSDSRVCLFGGTVQPYQKWGQQFVYASSADQTLKKGSGCAGDSVNDPVGATFNEIYNGSLFYVVWNDQFYDDPEIAGCTNNCSSPWGHSKGVLAWDENGNGLVMQVTTPSWPAAGSAPHPRQKDGNTLGCVLDNNVLVSQHFFALQLSKEDVKAVLQALANASIVTDPDNPQIVRNGGPADVSALAGKLGVKSKSTGYLKNTLSSGVVLISKPSALHVPPWQMVSSLLGGGPLRAATWWANPQITSTTKSTKMVCWDKSLAKPGAVQIATTGQWDATSFGLTGGPGANYNHAKIGVSTAKGSSYVILGDLNQQGNATDKTRSCASSQNGRGGLFYVINDAALAASVAALIKGKSAPTKAPKK
jgi:hypothetical protein